VHPVLHDSALFAGEEEHQEHTRKRVGKIMGNHEGFRRVDSRQLDGKGVEGAQGNVFSLPAPPSHRMFRHQLLDFTHEILFFLYRIRFIGGLFAFANNAGLSAGVRGQPPEKNVEGRMGWQRGRE